MLSYNFIARYAVFDTVDMPSITQFGHTVATPNVVIQSLVFNNFNITVPYVASKTLKYAVYD